MAGERRPWHAGVLWDKDPRIAEPLIRKLSAAGDWHVGDNEPYSGRHPADFTLDHHAEAEGLAHVGIEIRQDLAAQAAGAQRCAECLARALGEILTDPALYTHRAGTR
jgi:predicted N-formylglutamate amidohydrolase